MFKGAQANPYDDIVGKATDETLTSENWELILNLCDKVQDEGEQGARNVTAAILKRLSHRNPNVPLYSLVLAESLSKNCGKELHREIASRAFTQALERLITDRTTHDRVRRRILMLIAMWTEDFESDPTLGIMEECYESLKAKNYKYEPVDEPAPTEDDEARKREEEELQRVLELSVQDKGGRKNWGEYSLASSSGAGGSSSKASTAYQPAATPASSSSTTQGPQPPYSSGYVPSTEAHTQAAPAAAESPPPSLPSASPTLSATPSAEVYGVTRVRALHAFEPTESNELAFEKGDIIKVVNREYKDWWRGQLRGRTGIFPVNYVEPLPEPTATELAAEAQQEAAVFSQAANVDRLLTMLRTLDPAKDNLADNEEIQELYRSCMTLRPKIVKLIDKYSQKRADLVSMNESFVKARTIFDRMMEESLARHSEYYEQQRPIYVQPQSTVPRTESHAQGQQPLGFGRPTDQPQAYGWNQSMYDQPGYNAFPTPGAVYPRPQQSSPIPDPRVGLARHSSYGAPQPHPQSQPQPQQLQIQTQSQPVQQAPQPQPQTAYVQPYPSPENQRASYYPQQPPQQTEPHSQPATTYPSSDNQRASYYHQQPPQQTESLSQPAIQSTGQPQGQQQPQVQLQPQIHAQFEPQLQHAQSRMSIQPQPQPQSMVPQQQQQPQPQPQPQTQTQPQTQPPETQAHPHAQAQTQQQTMTGPPFVFDPTAVYPDQNVQAWAHYYAQGGTDPTGSVYFISVPGITDARSSPTAAVHPQPQGQVEEQPSSSPETSSARLQRQSSLPNPYASSNVSELGENVSPVITPGAGGNTLWQSLPGQFAQMCVGKPSMGA
jgi:signal transducing adaptor molecule